MIVKGSIKYGEIYLVNFDPSVGHEFKSRRPALVIQSDAKISRSNLVTVIPFTSNIKNKINDDIFVKKSGGNKLFIDSVLKVYCLMSLDYSRFIKKTGVIEPEILDKVRLYLKEHFGL